MEFSIHCLIFSCIICSAVSGLEDVDKPQIALKAEDNYQYSWQCGGYYYLPISAKKDSPMFIYSPNYPHDYLPRSYCVWNIEIEKTHRKHCVINMVVQNFLGEHFNGECSDYIEIRDRHHVDQTLLSRICNNGTNSLTKYKVSTQTFYARIKFKSDGINNNSKKWRIGLFTNDECTGKEVENWDDARKPKPCKSYQFRCRNDECISMSYRCDGINDCGCVSGCDEDKCVTSHGWGHKLEKEIAFVIGVCLFIFVVAIGRIVETKEKLKAEIQNLNLPESQHRQRRRESSILTTRV